MFLQGYPTSDKATSLASVRRDLEGTVARDAAGKIRAGIFPSHTGELVTRRPDMRLDILDFRAVQDKRGACFIANEGTLQSPAFAAAPAANRRIDVLYVTQKISTIDGGTTEAVPLIVTGNASPTPIRPTLPAIHADAIPLYAMEIPVGATSMQSAGVILTPIFPYTAAAGGVVHVRNQVELAAWKPGDGARAYCGANSSEYIRKGGEWLQRGVQEVTPIMSPGWSVTAGYDTKIRVDETGLCTFNSLLRFGTPGSVDNIFTAPADVCPAANTFVGMSRINASRGSLHGSLRLSPAGRLDFPADYYTGNITNDSYVPVALTWRAA